MAQVPSIEEHEALADLVRQQGDQIKRLNEALDYFMSEPQGWRSVSECCQFFTARKNQPVDRHTMKVLIDHWIVEGILILGKNVLNNPSGGYFVNVEFLKGAPLPKESRLKKVA